MILTAEREGVTQLIGEFDGLTSAQREIESREEAGTWPEGYDAVATDSTTGERWLYSDDWEVIT